MKNHFRHPLRLAFFWLAMSGAQFSIGQSYISEGEAVNTLMHEAEMTLVQRASLTQDTNEYSMLSLEKDLYKYAAKYISKDEQTVGEAIDSASTWLNTNGSSYYQGITESQKEQLTTELEAILAE